MQSVLTKVVWGMLEKLDVTSVEAQILLALSHFTIVSSGRCRPTLEQISAKTHLSRSTVKEHLARLKEKGLLTWKGMPAHRNEYSLACSQASNGIVDNGCIPDEKEYRANKAEYDDKSRRAVFLLAWVFTMLLRDRTQAPLALPEYQTLVAVRPYGACVDLFFGLRSEIRQHEHDHEDIHELVVRSLKEIPDIGESDFTRTVR